MSAALRFVNGSAVLADRVVADAAVLCRDGRIEAVGSRSTVPGGAGIDDVDADGGLILPGFVDIHVHGGDGADYMDGTAEAVRIVDRAHARHGTTTIFPTTTTGLPSRIDAMLDACAAVRDAWTILDGARIGGVHYYGPFFAPDKVGCHDPAGRRDPSPSEYRRRLAQGLVRVATCAAELTGATRFYRAASKAGCLVTCGHSNASWDEMEKAFAAGMRHVDHFWCAMSSVPSMRARFGVPMRGSMAEFVLMHREMSTEVIADGQHLAPELLRFAYVMKGADRLCLVTDANRALDMPPGNYRFGSCEDGTWFRSNGKVGWMPNGSLASSVVGMDRMTREMLRATEAPLHEVVRMASLTPAERVGMADQIGSLAVGKRADVLVADSSLKIKRIFIDGIEFEPRAAEARKRGRRG